MEYIFHIFFSLIFVGPHELFKAAMLNLREILTITYK